MVNPEVSLATVSFNPGNEVRYLAGFAPSEVVRRLQESRDNYTAEVVTDEPLPQTRYLIDDLTESGMDEREREGEFIEGFKTMKSLLDRFPGNIILWYSPAGPAAFEHHPDNPYSSMRFDYGQLYVQYKDVEEKPALALKVTNDDLIAHLMPRVHEFAKRQKTEEGQIKHYLINPINTGLSVDEFFNHPWRDLHTYTNKYNETFSFHQILNMMRDRFAVSSAKTIDPEIWHMAHGDLTESAITRMYMQAVNNEFLKRFDEFGEERLVLRGSCGGGTVTRSFIESVLGITNIFSTEYRAVTSGESDLYYEDYACPNCGYMLSGESKTDQSSWRDTCDHCNKEINCKPTATKETAKAA